MKLSLELTGMNVHILQLLLQSVVVFGSLLYNLFMISCIFSLKLFNLFSKIVELLQYSFCESIDILEELKHLLSKLVLGGKFCSDFFFYVFNLLNSFSTVFGVLNATEVGLG